MAAADPLSTLQLVAIAGAGGFVWNMVDLWEDGKKPRDKRTPKDLRYWTFFIFWPCSGAALAWLYILDGSTLRPLLSFSIGLSISSTLQAMVAKALPVPPPDKEQK
ncbi:hypothetical protein [Duganella sp. BuS-21]|uniref:hypothetical protein n=1 Tax=Duganella sp. BuS-21 TaxID=2943848 RepID=UPI0035A6384A